MVNLAARNLSQRQSVDDLWRTNFMFHKRACFLLICKDDEGAARDELEDCL